MIITRFIQTSDSVIFIYTHILHLCLLLPTPTIAVAWLDHSVVFVFLSVCFSVCSKRKMTRAINSQVGRDSQWQVCMSTWLYEYVVSWLCSVCSGCQLVMSGSETRYHCSECTAKEFIYCENCFQSRRCHTHPFNKIIDSGPQLLHKHKYLITRLSIMLCVCVCVCVCVLSLIHIWRCRRSYAYRSRWSPYH